MQDGIRAVQQAFADAATPPRWPMYVRQAKQFLRTAIEGFDERKYGFASVVDLLRAAGKEGVLRIERDRQGAVRVFPGLNLLSRPHPVGLDGLPADVEDDAEPGNEAVMGEPVTEVVADLPIVEAQVDDERQPFAPAPAGGRVLGDDEDEGPQPGNEIAPSSGPPAVSSDAGAVRPHLPRRSRLPRAPRVRGRRRPPCRARPGLASLLFVPAAAAKSRQLAAPKRHGSGREGAATAAGRRGIGRRRPISRRSFRPSPSADHRGPTWPAGPGSR